MQKGLQNLKMSPSLKDHFYWSNNINFADEEHQHPHAPQLQMVFIKYICSDINRTVCQHEQHIRKLKDTMEEKEKVIFVVLLNLSWGERWEQFMFLPSGGSTLLKKAEKQQQKAKQKIKTQPSSEKQNKKKKNPTDLSSTPHSNSGFPTQNFTKFVELAFKPVSSCN